MKLTQRELDKVSNLATNLKDALSVAESRLNGQGIYIGEDTQNVFDLCDRLRITGIQKNKVRNIQKLLSKADSLLGIAEQLAEELEMWADDQDPK